MLLQFSRLGLFLAAYEGHKASYYLSVPTIPTEAKSQLQYQCSFLHYHVYFSCEVNNPISYQCGS